MIGFLRYGVIIGIALFFLVDPAAGQTPGAPGTKPIAARPLSNDDMFKIIVQRRAETFNPGGAPLEDPLGKGHGVGPDASHAPRGFDTGVPTPGAKSPRLAGDSVFAVVQVVDKDGQLLDVAAGEHVSYAGRGAEHAESRALRVLEGSEWSNFAKATPDQMRGGKVIAMVDQVPCEESCASRLRDFARQHEMGLEVYVPARKPLRGRGGLVSPRTTARTSHRTDVTGNPRFRTRFIRLDDLTIEPPPSRWRRLYRPPPRPPSEPRRLYRRPNVPPSPGTLAKRVVVNIGAAAALGLLTDWMKSEITEEIVALRGPEDPDDRQLAEMLRDPRNEEARKLLGKLANELPRFDKDLAGYDRHFNDRFDRVLNSVVSRPEAPGGDRDPTAEADQLLLQYDAELATIENNLDHLLGSEPQALAAAKSAEDLQPLLPLTADSLVRMGFDGDELVQINNFLRSYPTVTRKAFENARKSRNKVRNYRSALRDLGLSVAAIADDKAARGRPILTPPQKPVPGPGASTPARAPFEVNEAELRDAGERERRREEEEQRATEQAEKEERRREAEERRRREEAERRRKQDEKRRAEAEERRRANAEERRRADEERRQRAEQERRRRAEEQRRREEAEGRRRAQEEKRRAEAEERRRADAEARRRAEEERRRDALEKQRKLEAERRKQEEARRRKAEDDRRKAEEERKRLAEEARRRAETEERRLTEESRRQAERQRLENEGRRRTEERQRAEEQRRREAAERRRLAEEERRRAAAEERRRLDAENRRRADEERRQRAEEERRQRAEEQRRREEAERRRQAEEEKRRAAAEERRRAEAEARRRADEERRQRAEEERRQRAEERRRQEEAKRRREEEERREKERKCMRALPSLECIY